jgi:predicted kinase
MILRLAASLGALGVHSLFDDDSPMPARFNRVSIGEAHAGIAVSGTRMRDPRLIIFSGLPGAGKTTLAKRLAAHLNAVYLRADTIETVLKNGGITDIGGLGYSVGYATAKENLSLGNTVVADSVNPWQLTRDAWRQAGREAGKRSVDVEIVCSDLGEHRGRVEGRAIDVEGLQRPTWQEVLDRDYHPWNDPCIRINRFFRPFDDG